MRAARSPRTAGESTCAEGHPETTRATSAIHAAHHPASQASAAAAPGKTGSIAAAASASEMSGAMAGSAATFAGTVQSAIAPKWSQTIGAVTTPHAIATTKTSKGLRGTGYASGIPATRGSATKIAATAAKDSWKPGSSPELGIQARSTSAPTASACQRSRGRATIHASDASTPATAARTTDGCQPTASAYASTTAIAIPSPARRPMPTTRATVTTPIAVIAMFCPETASKCISPLALNASSSEWSIPLSSPSTIPASRRRRSPVVPLASVASTCARSRSATPPIPPRRPTMRARSPRSTTWTPRRASQPRSSKPVSGPRGSTGRARNSRMDPCGGARSGGSSRSTRSRIRVAPKRVTSAGIRNANGVRFGGPVVTTRADAVSPIRAASALRSSASPRSVPHHRPAHASATAPSASRCIPLARTATTAATVTPRAAVGGGGRAQTEAAMPDAAEQTRSAGQFRAMRRRTRGAVTASPARATARCVRGRCPGRRRDPRPSGRGHGPSASRRSSGP